MTADPAQVPLVDRLGVVSGHAVFDAHERAIKHAIAIGLTPNFKAWLAINWAIWDEFVKLSDQMRLRGRKYYSARAVIHVLRWHRALRDTTETELKINNNRSAEMARLYNSLVGKEFFRTRGE